MPSIEPYQGITDLLNHLECYNTLMRIQGTTNILLYLTFLATLQKLARVWYSRLESRSINSFVQLEYKFTTYFSTHQRVPCELDSLFALQQHDKESLKDYLA